MRAEVGVLTRNVQILGEVKDDADVWGGHVHIIGTASVQIDVRVFDLDETDERFFFFVY